MNTALGVVLGVLLPYAALFIFVVGIIYRVVTWARSPVPFRIPSTCGQQKTLGWLPQSPIDNPSGTAGVWTRMALEVLLFRSLFRNTRCEVREGPRLTYTPSIWLWLGALAFHYCFLVIVVRHLRYFLEPVPFFVTLLERVDGFFQVGIPMVMVSSVVITAALLFLLLRRLLSPQMRYLSLPSDYFALGLLLAIVLSGLAMRHIFKVDVVAVKELGVALLSLQPWAAKDAFDGLGLPFYVHLVLVCTLLIYFPFSKLVHAPGIFLSPTRNLANNNREKRHVNPWNYAVKVHTYEEWEDDFREKLKATGYPLEKE